MNYRGILSGETNHGMVSRMSRVLEDSKEMSGDQKPNAETKDDKSDTVKGSDFVIPTSKIVLFSNLIL